jgi:protein O-GlcNAc transferase
MTTSHPQGADAARAHFQQANSRYAQNDFNSAILHYREALKLNPDYPEAYNNQGLALGMLGRNGEAAESFKQAIALRPNYAIAHNNYGNLLQTLGQPELAAEHYRKAIAFRPDYADAYNNLGNVLKAEGRLEDAGALYHKAIALNPNHADAHYNLGFLHQSQGRLPEAEKDYRNAVALRPNYADACNNLGTVLKLQGRLTAALESYQKAQAAAPGNVQIFCNLGDAHLAAGNLDDAAAIFTRAIALDPSLAEPHDYLGNVLQLQGEFERATESFIRALELDPNRSETCFDFGNALWEQGRAQDAIANYRKALELAPDNPLALSNLLYAHARARDVSPEQERDLAATWETISLTGEERAAARDRALKRDPLFSYAPRAGRKLKLGITSAELGQHPVAEFLEPLLEQIDRSRFHVTLYPTIERPEPRAERFRKLADAYTPIAHLSDSAAASRIREDKIDVLIDTTGHMKGCRLGLYAHRAAPVQAHYIGYHGTTGLTEMDWFIADEELLPASYDAHFRERIWRLPRLRLAYKGDESLPRTGWSPDPSGTLRLGTFNNLTKVREEALSLWAKVLHALPEAKLLLKDSQPVIPAIRQRIASGLAQHGIADDRVEFPDATPDWRAHMALYSKLDVALDTLPLNSETTAFDALWMGVPCVALQSDWYGGRMVAAMLKSLDQPEWIARNAEEYVARVAALARNVEGRKALRSAQRERMKASPLCDVAGLARLLEAAFEAMFDAWADPAA